MTFTVAGPSREPLRRGLYTTAPLGVMLIQQRIARMPQIHYPLSLDATPSPDDFKE
jgi:hypothetical protein